MKEFKNENKKSTNKFFEKNFIFFTFNEEDFYSFLNILRLKDIVPTTIIVLVNLWLFCQYLFITLRKQYGFAKTGDSIMEYWKIVVSWGTHLFDSNLQGILIITIFIIQIFGLFIFYLLYTSLSSGSKYIKIYVTISRIVIIIFGFTTSPVTDIAKNFFNCQVFKNNFKLKNLKILLKKIKNFNN